MSLFKVNPINYRVVYAQNIEKKNEGIIVQMYREKKSVGVLAASKILKRQPTPKN
jgi:hypothetical protein